MTAACIIPASREVVVAGKRKALTRREVIQLMLDQNGRCGCGCGVKLDPMGEGVIDEHINPREVSADDSLANRALYRTPCAKRKTTGDHKTIAKVKRLEARHNGTRRPRKPIPSPANPWPKGKTQWAKRGFEKRTDG